jgi:excisionase family DNA binding protein
MAMNTTRTTNRIPDAVERGNDRLLTLEQTAAELNVPLRFVRRLVSERRIAVVRLGRHLRIAGSDIDRYVAACRTEPVKRSKPCYRIPEIRLSEQPSRGTY